MDKSELKALIKKAETIELTDEERKKLSGSFISLPSGNTHYEIHGSGEPIVLVHGYATPYYIYDKLFDAFIKAGYRVLRYDLLGRGFSERVETDYTPELFAAQLRELTQALLGDESFHLVGTSMGGSVTTTFCRLYPDSVKSLILLAPAGMDSFKPAFYMKLSNISGLGEVLFRLIGSKSLLNGCASELHYSIDEKDDYMRAFADAFRYKGFLRCTLSSLRNTILRTDKTILGYEAVEKSKIPVLCIWGKNDKTMPYYQSDRFKEVCPSAKLLTYEKSGHIFLYDEGERTVADILAFLKEQEPDITATKM